MLYIKILGKDSWKPIVSEYWLPALRFSYVYFQDWFKAMVTDSFVLFH